MKLVTCLSKVEFVLSVFCFCVVFSTAADTISKTRSINDPQTIESNGSSFKLGFFYPSGSANRYVGIWYSNASVPNVVWVANRNDPLIDTSGAVKVSEDGNLVVLNGQNDVLWTSNVSNSVANATVQLLDSGNLVLKEPGTGNILWQSFQHPTDSFLPTMKMTTNPKTGQRLKLTSWSSSKDPAQGDYYAGLDVSASNVSQIYLWKNDIIYWSSGPWNGNAFMGIHSMNSAYLSGFSVVAEDDGTSYVMYTTVESFLTSFRLNPEGKILQLDWQDSTKDWQVSWTSQETDCDVYEICGAFGICNSQNHPICSCLRGFQPKNQAEWNSGNWTSGCTRRSLLQCERATNGSGNGNADGFLKLNEVKVPDFAIPSSDSEFSCRTLCLENCSCLAYAYDSGVGCMRWTRNLIDMQEFTSGGGTDVYLRVAYSELDKKKNVKTIIIATSVAGAVIIVILCLVLAWRFKAKRKVKKAVFMDIRDSGNMISGSDVLINSAGYELQDLPLFSFEELASATNDFHADNKLGQGGFGPVYRGTLPNEQEIAVKRLSSASGQGLEEFMNEVVVISKLQHRNLVRLLGCCTGRQEKILVYEFMPNKSLDAYLFDPLKQKLLPWAKRFQIIGGIGRGLLYLHRDSRLKIIHRDLKASNILLDEELLPKISDFGMARIFGNNQDQANTARVVGTYGYMAPEYAMQGRFSEKSDVYSFGVLVLEIISGRKNTGFYNNEHSHSLLGYAWKLWKEGNIAALIDISIFGPSFKDEMVRCIHIGLLCVQEYEKDRPSVSTILSMLSSEIVDLPAPQQPAFSARSTHSDTDSSQMSQKTSSTNNITMTVIEGR